MEIQTKPQITFFNRHENMDSETRFFILDVIKELCYKCETTNTARIENWLYGAFDGYDYSSIAIFSKDMADLTHENTDLACKVSEIFSIIEKYPRTAEPNNNIF
jgi:hypothetical protein